MVPSFAQRRKKAKMAPERPAARARTAATDDQFVAQEAVDAVPGRQEGTHNGDE